MVVEKSFYVQISLSQSTLSSFLFSSQIGQIECFDNWSRFSLFIRWFEMMVDGLWDGGRWDRIFFWCYSFFHSLSTISFSLIILSTIISFFSIHLINQPIKILKNRIYFNWLSFISWKRFCYWSWGFWFLKFERWDGRFWDDGWWDDDFYERINGRLWDDISHFNHFSHLLSLSYIADKRWNNWSTCHVIFINEFWFLKEMRDGWDMRWLIMS